MEKIPFRLSLRFRIIFLVIGLTLLATVITSVYYLKQIQSITVFELQHEGVLLSDLLESGISRFVLKNDISEVQNYIDRIVTIRKKNDIEINVMLIQGDRSAIVASNIPDNIEETSPEEHAALIASLKHDQPVIFIDTDEDVEDENHDNDSMAEYLTPDHPDYYFPPGQRFLSITTPLIDKENKRGSINVKLSLSILDQKIGHIRNGIYAVSLAEVVLLIVSLIFFLNRQFLRPLNSIIENIIHIGHSGIEQRLETETRRDEFGMLGREFNRMMDRINILVGEMRVMADNIAHDLKSPLTRIRGTAEITLTSDSTKDEFAAMTASTIEECDNMLTIINTMLYISAAEADALEIEKTSVNISAVVRNTCELFQAAAENLCIQLSIVIPDDFYVVGDRHMLQRIIANLLENALKYTSSGGYVSVEMRRLNDKISIRMVDSGIGISPDELPLIFKRYYRCDQSRSKPGIGLGLSLVKALLKLHQGDITVSSSINKGSVFTVFLPLAKPINAKK